MSLSNPLNLLLVPPFLFLAYRILVPPPPHSPPEYNALPAEHPHVICHSTFTPAQLAQYDGTKGDRILLAIMRVTPDGKIDPNGERTVFDVSAGKTFYGPDGVYGNFAGRDASRGMAKQSFEPEVLTPIDEPLDDLSDLTASEIENMRGWHQHFEGKYIVCGELVNG
ncbi:hypothetical protein CNAG_01771 [Cryptococcus neoformans var. grubii H99]|uniref:Cytochrome b5 heme-binding domain-containing protein n=1 Tax=Cryptococcus neoformans (strain H99 / ATCC 208821 / CBS 10515 / FGSC 9487) TaxID=235443 RepID=J9VZA7_CRYN9|nr:hypothetical protein CNAG_01771 [Cryptococcus neoformans var. grubii H99]AFR97974.1 hypothetical protein CNAG_01771 [Cryptococcus neoformans var. grubii H99]AUB28059.1 hypothetical protein CKF44_01771 [Cryptococcus neoformans var. grubii]|eukprot:XP_012052744.1 hypothetical protein CNAG_01771 [Cryptococcus neoformans var. grubii H99]